MAYDNRLAMFERYIHTNRCNDENGWFASFCPNGQFDEQMFEYRSTGCESEEEAVRLLIQAACKDIQTMESDQRPALKEVLEAQDATHINALYCGEPLREKTHAELRQIIFELAKGLEDAQKKILELELKAVS